MGWTAEQQKNIIKYDRTNKEGMRKLKHWFGDESDIKTEESSSSESEEELSDPSNWKQIQIKRK